MLCFLHIHVPTIVDYAYGVRRAPPYTMRQHNRIHNAICTISTFTFHSGAA